MDDSKSPPLPDEAERRVRAARALAGVAFFVSALSVIGVMATAVVVVAALSRSKSAPPPKTLRCEHIEIVNEFGQRVMALGSSGGNGILNVYRADGRVAVALYCSKKDNAGCVLVTDRAGKTTAIMTTAPNKMLMAPAGATRGVLYIRMGASWYEHRRGLSVGLRNAIDNLDPKAIEPFLPLLKGLMLQ